jgi:uncharacterized Tic20 family protein
MNPFQILQIRKNIKDARANPSGFAGEQTKEILWGIMIIPIIICALVIILFFVIGYTDVLGFQLGFFKFLFWVALIVSFSIFSLLRRIIRATSRTVTSGSKRVIEAVVVESTEENKEV